MDSTEREQIMRRVTLNGIGQIEDLAVRAAIDELMLASAENDLLDIATPFTTNAAFTETRVLNVTAPSLANIAAVLATFIADCKRGGQFRNN